MKFVPVCSVLLLVLLSLTVFPLTYETNYTEAADTPTPTLTVSTTNPDVSLTPTVAGKFAEAKGTITVNTNNYTGYTLTIKSNTTNTGKLVNQEDNTKYLSSIPAGPGISQSSFRDDATYNNMWGYRPSMLNSTTNSNYLSAPSTTGDLLDNHKGSGTINYDIYLGVRANLNLPAGEYNNTFIITATANVAHYTITYNKNTTDTVSVMPSTQDADGTTVIIGIASGRSGYNFLDWCTVAVTDGAACSGTTYAPGSTFTADPTQSNEVTLYARWESAVVTFDQAFANAGKSKQSGFYKMQDMTASICSAVTGPTNTTDNISTQLIDTRDSEIYWVSKLLDGNCWMTQNLRLGGTTAIDLTSDDTNITKDWTLPASSTDKFSSSTGYTTAGMNSDYKNTIQEGVDWVPAGKIGNYYNYCAASAGTYCHASESGTGDATQDICPAGWRMPTGGSSGEYQALYDAYGDDGAFVTALSTPLSGFFNDGSAGSQGDDGRFWSSTWRGGRTMYGLYVDPSVVDPTSYNYRYYGISVRCVAQ